MHSKRLIKQWIEKRQPLPYTKNTVIAAKVLFAVILNIRAPWKISINKFRITNERQCR